MMTQLSAKKRRRLSKRSFGLPNRKAYPMPDKAHAVNAKARATQMYRKGKLSKSGRDRVHAKANRVLGTVGKPKQGGKKKAARRRTRKR